MFLLKEAGGDSKECAVGTMLGAVPNSLIVELNDFPYSMLQHTLIWKRSAFSHSFLKIDLTNLFTNPIFKLIIFEIGSGICIKDTCTNFAQLFCSFHTPLWNNPFISLIRQYGYILN